jgi:hypothetical protein
MIATFLTTFLLANASLDVLVENELNTAEGRMSFLIEKLTPFVTHADELNREITLLADQIKAEAEEIELAEKMTTKMGEMAEILPTLETALHVHEDFAKLDDLFKEEALSPEQQEIADRVAHLCQEIDLLNKP